MKAVRIFLKIIYVAMPLTIVMAFLWAPPAALLGDASRILYFHVPIAWVSFLAFVVSGILSILHLSGVKKQNGGLDEKAYHSAAIGFTFTIMTVITGSIWARISWGTFWNWDPRETSIVIILLIYIAYFSLQGALTDNEKRGRIGSTYLILAMVTLPFFVFLVPRLYPSLHPDPIINADKKIYLDDHMKLTLIVGILSFSILYCYLFDLMNRILVIRKKIEEYRETSN
ncbi:MAG: cytochrome c biogenesis protein CcsA [Spirochaetes bacterium]|nr:cytochrome c biogenesis protein CcsA [Spirochaetota bacterium]